MGYDSAELEQMYNRQSGLLGVSEYSNDIRDLENRAADGHEGSERALDMFAYRIKKYICMYLGILNGCDAVVFTGGIGENSPTMRARILSGMDNIGIQLDDNKNMKVVSKQGSIQTEYARIRLFVIPTDEEALIARDTYAIISNGHYN
jgi:acetate kinase